MEFGEKLQQLRIQHHLTQEELAQALYVSRTAVSKWESGRGYPNIDSLKAIAAYFEVTVDALLSGEEWLTVAAKETEATTTRLRDLVYGLLDISMLLLLFLPFFGETEGGAVRAVSLLSLTRIASYMRVAYCAVVMGTAVFGIVTLALQGCTSPWWIRSKRMVSFVCSGVGVLLFILSPQPYAAALLFVFLLIKILLQVKAR